MFVSLRSGLVLSLSALVVLALPLEAYSQQPRGRGGAPQIGGGAPRGGGGGAPRMGIGGGAGPRIGGGAPMGAPRFSAPAAGARMGAPMGAPRIVSPGGAPRMMGPRGGGVPRMAAPGFSRGGIPRMTAPGFARRGGSRIGAPAFSRGGARFAAPGIGRRGARFATPGVSRGSVRAGRFVGRPGIGRTVRGGRSIYAGRGVRGRAGIYAGRGARSAATRRGTRIGNVGRANRLAAPSIRAARRQQAARAGGAGRLTNANAAARFSAPQTFAQRGIRAGGRQFARQYGRQFVNHARDRRYWRRLGFFGWAGPLYWPYAYNDIFYDMFWTTSYYEDPFWSYGYPDIYYGGLFSPFEYEELEQWAPPRGRIARAAPGDVTGGTGSGGSARGRSGGRAPVSSRVTQMCGDEAGEITAWPIERIEQAVQPNAEQRAALDVFATASVQAAQRIKAACPTSIAFTPPARLAQMQDRIEAMRQAVEIMLPPLEKFYGLLDDEQKARLNAIGGPGDGKTDPNPVQTCMNAATGVTDWPAAEIDRLVRPNAGQREKLDALRDANIKAADALKASCPTETPATPPARLAAIGKRLDALGDAIRTVRGSLEAFYASLNDEQKGQFNTIGRVPQAAQQ